MIHCKKRYAPRIGANTRQKTKIEVTIPILNENLITICENYGYNIPKANEQVLTKLTMKQKEAERSIKKGKDGVGDRP